MGPLMVDVSGLELTEDDVRLLQSPAVGGVILFARNYQDRSQLAALTGRIHVIKHPRLLIAVDQEGGRVQRFRSGFTELPPLSAFGKIYQRDRSKALHLAESTAWLMASELLEVGIDFSFAPVVDLNFGVSEVIGDRSFHRQVDTVSALANAWIRGMHRAGMASVAKHFPGHGAVAADSHMALPIDKRSYGDLLVDDLVPFQRAIEHGVKGIMTAHIIYSSMHTAPATFSSYWLQQVLRQQLGFRGAVFSDDLSMLAVADYGDIVTRTKLALEAGCDMALICNAPADSQLACATLTDTLSATSLTRLTPFHGKRPGGSDYAEQKSAAIKNVASVYSDADAVQLDLE